MRNIQTHLFQKFIKKIQYSQLDFPSNVHAAETKPEEELSKLKRVNSICPDKKLDQKFNINSFRKNHQDWRSFIKNKEIIKRTRIVQPTKNSFYVHKDSSVSMKNLSDDKGEPKSKKLTSKLFNLSFMKQVPIKVVKKSSPNIDRNNHKKESIEFKVNSIQKIDFINNDKMSKNYNFTKFIKTEDERQNFKSNGDLPSALNPFDNIKIDKTPKAYQQYNLIQMSQTADEDMRANPKAKKYSFKNAVEEKSLEIAQKADKNYTNDNQYGVNAKQSINNVTGVKEQSNLDAIKKSDMIYKLTKNNSSLTKLQKKIPTTTKQIPKKLPKIEDKEMEINEDCEISMFFENDNYIFNFFSHIHSKKSIYDDFRAYFAFIQDTSFDIILELFSSKKLAEQFKKALILERISIFICFYYDLNQSYKREIEFLKKFISIVYANSYILIKIFVSNCETDLYEEQIVRIRNRKLILNEEDVDQNNAKLYNMLDTLIKDLDPIVGTCFTKIGRFQHEFSLDEAFKYLIDVFSELVE